MIFVFGSNLQGKHGAGSALEAKLYWGAKEGQGTGIQGSSFAIPTKYRPTNYKEDILSVDRIQVWVNKFVAYAEENPQYQFFLTRIGCGFAGYKDEQIAPMFKETPSNVIMCPVWEKIIAKEI